MRLERHLVAVAIVICELFARANIARGHQNQMRLAAHLEQLGVAITAQLRVVQEASEATRLGRGVYAVRLGFVLEEVHVAADAFVARVPSLALLGLRVAYGVAGVLDHELSAAKRFGGEHAAALALNDAHGQTLFELPLDSLLDLDSFLFLQVRLTFSRALAYL